MESIDISGPEQNKLCRDKWLFGCTLHSRIIGLLPFRVKMLCVDLCLIYHVQLLDFIFAVGAHAGVVAVMRPLKSYRTDSSLILRVIILEKSIES